MGRWRQHADGVVHRARGWLFQLLEWIGRHELSVLIALLIVVGGCWAFIEIADEVVEGDTDAFDRWAVQALRKADDPATPIGPRWMAEVGRDMTALGGVTVLACLTIAVAVYLWLRRMYGAMWLVIAATTGGLIATSLLKYLVDRPRPDVVPHLSIVHSSSFPSGHSMMAATVYLTLGALLGRFVSEMRLRAFFLGVAIVLTLMVGFSRVYMGVHYPTDVLAGWSAGLAWATLCWIVARRLQQRGAVEQEANRR